MDLLECLPESLCHNFDVDPGNPSITGNLSLIVPTCWKGIISLGFRSCAQESLCACLAWCCSALSVTTHTRCISGCAPHQTTRLLKGAMAALNNIFWEMSQLSPRTWSLPSLVSLLVKKFIF